MNPFTNHEEEIISMVNMTKVWLVKLIEKYQSLVNNLELNSLAFDFQKLEK